MNMEQVLKRKLKNSETHLCTTDKIFDALSDLFGVLNELGVFRLTTGERLTHVFQHVSVGHTGTSASLQHLNGSNKYFLGVNVF